MRSVRLPTHLSKQSTVKQQLQWSCGWSAPPRSHQSGCRVSKALLIFYIIFPYQYCIIYFSIALPPEADQTHPALPWDYISEPTLSSSMGAMDNHSPLNSCSCNRSVCMELILFTDIKRDVIVLFLCVSSEAILALQTEVSKLKRDLEQGLVQLPHLTQRMDCLISKYRQEDLEHRSKIQTDQTSASKR